MGRRVRPFRVSDLMILVVAAALGALGTRAVWPLIGMALEGLADPDFRSIGHVLPLLLSAWASAATLGFIAVRLRRPHPRRARLIRQPGIAAAVSVGVVVAFQALTIAANLATRALTGISPGVIHGVSIRAAGLDLYYADYVPSRWHSSDVFTLFAANLAFPCGLAVIVVWTFLLVAGLWRAEGSWIDRLGRILGAFWIAITVHSAAGS